MSNHDRDAQPLPAELTPRQFLRWSWRQLTSMRTALILLFLLALAAIPGSLIPQSDVDALKTSRWKDAHPSLTPIYEKLGLFSVFDSVWFSAIYLLLVISLVGCILPRTRVYWRALRSRPPRTPAHLTRLPVSASYPLEAGVEVSVEQARQVLRARGYRVETYDDSVSAEKGYLREAGNLLFHLSVLVVIIGFALGSMYGYRGGVIVVKGDSFSNTLTQYDDFVPGRLFDSTTMEPFNFTVDDFDITWLTSGPRFGMAQDFVAGLRYTTEPGAEPKSYNLRVNHPLTIGDTQLFLIGHGYAPVITVRDGNGDVAYSGPVLFLPVDQRNFTSFGVVKAPDARPQQLGLEGELFPTFQLVKGDPYSTFGAALDPLISMQVYAGDLNMDTGIPQSIYVMDKSRAKLVTKPDGSMFRVDLRPGETQKLPRGLGSVTFDSMKPWVKIQISKSPGKDWALLGVLLALLGLCGSLFIRSRRVWVRVRPADAAEAQGAGTIVEIAVLDRAGGGDPDNELAAIRAALAGQD